MKNPKAKGGKFEREVCVVLSLWVSQGKRRDLFWRSAMSGGRATVHGRSVRQVGDVCAVAPEGHQFTDKYFVECKHLKSLDFIGLIEGRGRLLKYWHIAQAQAAKHELIPMLIAKQNNHPVILCCEQHVQFHSPLATFNAYDMHLYRFNDLLKRRYHEFVPRRKITFHNHRGLQAPDL
jgi:hypothetical protein